MSDHIDELVTMLQQDSPFRDGTPSYKSWRNERDNAAVELATIAREADIERKRGDFFRDAVAAARGCPPSPVEVACQEGDVCPFISDDGYPDYAICWDEVERRQR